MDFDFSDEQLQLRDSLQRWLRDSYGFAQRRALLEAGPGSAASQAIWRGLAELGVLALTVPTTHGGLGGNAYDSLVVLDALGRHLVLEPYLSTVAIGAGLLARTGSAAQQARWLPAVAAGDCRIALAHFEDGARWARSYVQARAAPDGAGGWRLDGAKGVVLDGSSADLLLVSARLSGAPHDPAGLALFLVEAHAAGLQRSAYRTHDGRGAAELRLDGVQVGPEALLGTAGEGHALVELALDLGSAALCAEAVGIIDVLIAETTAYLKQRKQFGVPIGSFQALQHRVADMLVQAEQARSMSWLAAHAIDHEPPAERCRLLAAAKAVVGQAARHVGQQAVQLHGGIAVCDEFAVSHWFKRLTLIDATFGDAELQLARYSDLLLA